MTEREEDKKPESYERHQRIYRSNNNQRSHEQPIVLEPMISIPTSYDSIRQAITKKKFIEMGRSIEDIT